MQQTSNGQLEEQGKNQGVVSLPPFQRVKLIEDPGRYYLSEDPRRNPGALTITQPRSINELGIIGYLNRTFEEVHLPEPVSGHSYVVRSQGDVTVLQYWFDRKNSR